MKTGRYFFEVIDSERLDEQEFSLFNNKSVFTTIQWIEFIKTDSNAKPIIVRICDGEGNLIGYFTGLIIKKIGVKILGSPFRGWSTCYMGVDTNLTEEKVDIYSELVPFLLKKTRCAYMEITDRDITVETAKKSGFLVLPAQTLELDIDKDDEGLFKQMKTDCRNFIRQFERRGARLEIAQPDDEFAEEYYKQLEDVFAKQGLVPTYSVKKVKCLLKTMSKTDNVLCLKVISPDDKCIATSIFFGYNKKFFFWGGASYREDQHYRPNEYMIWNAIKYWRDKGCNKFDMVGVRDYKRKFGSYEQEYANMVFAKPKILLKGRILAERMYFKYIEIKGKILKKK